MKVYQVIIRPEAERDMTDAYDWYNRQVRGLGGEFLRCVDAAMASIQRSPVLYPQIHKRIHRILVRRFPFGIFYIIAGHDIIILAVFHMRRDPNRLKQRK